MDGCRLYADDRTCLPFVSMMSKWFSVKTLSNIALVAFILGAIISGVADNFTVLLIGLMIQGIGTGIILPLMFSMILEVFPPHKIGAAMGLAALVIMFAPAIGPTILYGSRFGFGFALCLAVFGFIISLFLKNTKKAGN